MRFTYKSGQRPLEGFTIKRGVGQGGFGEVYFAVSDGGKEAALKLLRGHTDVELRGVANCLNLKHPNLVHVYDLKNDERGDTWLIMEYVLGESMSQVINRHPNGLPVNLAKEWFGNLARAVGFLHDHGVVHRDLKPANIFIENGTLKVGDYGLCKSIHSNQRQTRTVGTVHYMAPEISTGNYNKQIDIYACGVILHEMLTGKLPFDGESDGEILMKHLTATPDLTKVPMPFRVILAKALDKNPLRRYGSTAEMARAVETVQLPTAHPPQTPVVGAPPVIAPPVPAADPSPAAVEASPARVASPAPKPPVPAGPPKPEAPKFPRATPTSSGSVLRDRITDRTGILLAAPFVAALALVPFALITQPEELATLGKLLLTTTLLSWAIVLGSGRATYRYSDSWVRRIQLAGLGMLIGVTAFWLEGWEMPRLAGSDTPSGETYIFGRVQMNPESLAAGLKYVLYFGALLGAGRWWRVVARDRKDRFSFFPLIAAAFWSCVLMFLWPTWDSGLDPLSGAIIPMVLATVAVQTASPWSPPPPPAPKKLKYRG